jgi:SAM-dependent methyltransferase
MHPPAKSPAGPWADDHTPARALTWRGRIFRALCRPPGSPEFPGGTARTTIDNALDFLLKTVPDFLDITRGAAVLDFGCGFGLQAAALARRGVDVTGLDLPRDVFASSWRDLNASHPTLHLTTEPPARTFDVVYSCSSFEHFADPAAILARMREYTRPGGTVVISFAEPWYSPHGHHMDGITRAPWVNLLFRERDVMAVRALYRTDGATRYEDVEGGLNRMTVARFEQLVRESGMRVRSLRLFAVKGLPIVTHLPVARELLTSACSAVLEN